ncbi:hypothetical protein TSAR_015062 [Trichomalopsis sarcophagae]|uniref:Odorant receptor n=1 Tax=Trichomalopsis sarcophagae TaxID=543379 RepID=A0A232EHU9_9HYME|nr:hypothetical protein TSAR_015062 [Trichomalopsis sarcophagae]
MELFESNYWKLTVFLQKLIGLYYFQSLWKNIVAWIYVYMFTLSFIIAIGVRLYQEIGIDINIVTENLIAEMYLIIVFAKLTTSVVYMKDLKHLYKSIANDWKVMSDEKELKVMHEYTDIGRKSVQLYSGILKIIPTYAGYMIIGITVFLSLPISAPLWDYIVPLENATRPNALPYYAEYGIDQEKYYFPLMGQAVFGGIGTGMLLVTFDLGFILTVQHVVALFALVCYRLDQAANLSLSVERGQIDFIKGDGSAYEYTVKAINLHQTVLGYVDLVENCYNAGWLVVLFMNMLLCGGGLAVLLMKTDRPEELLRYFTVLLAGFIHFYYIFLPGQKIINSSLEVFDKCYASRWYNLSEKSKNLIKIMMIRSLRRCELTGGKMFILCMDTYCNMMKTGLSVFTVLR